MCGYEFALKLFMSCVSAELKFNWNDEFVSLSDLINSHSVDIVDQDSKPLSTVGLLNLCWWHVSGDPLRFYRLQEKKECQQMRNQLSLQFERALTLISSIRCRLPTQMFPFPWLTKNFSCRWPEIKCCVKHSPRGSTSMLLIFIEFSKSFVVPHEKTWQ